MTNRLVQHHDQFFKRLLDKPGTAGALLRERLPPTVAARLSDDPPELLPGSFVPAELREYRTDRLYRVRTVDGRQLLIHTVVEHKSSPDPRIALQLLGYQTQILEWWDRTEGRDANGAPRPLPIVVSMVVYHGKTAWRVPLTLAEVVDSDADLRPYLVDFRYILVDLGPIPDALLSRHEVLRVGFLILKYGSRGGDLRATLLALGRAALALGFDDLVALVRYVLVDPNETEARMLREVLAEIMPQQEERVMSLAAEQLMAESLQEGLKRGRQEGRREERARTVLRLLERRFGSLAEPVRARVSAADLDTLDRWFDRALDAATLDAVFDDGRTH